MNGRVWGGIKSGLTSTDKLREESACQPVCALICLRGHRCLSFYSVRIQAIISLKNACVCTTSKMSDMYTWNRYLHN